MSKISVIGLDLTINIFQLDAVGEAGNLMLHKQLSSTQIQCFFVKLPPCLVGMEACGG